MFDGMEVGTLVPLAEGKWRDVVTGNIIDEDGRVFDSKGEMVYDPYMEDDCRD